MSVLEQIVERVRERLAETKRRVPVPVVRRDAEAAAARPSFRAAIEAEGTSLIAEAKARSPSKGVLRDPYDPVALARAYASAGARAVSVLTEPDFFDGAPAHLVAVRDAVALPVLRKDFVVDEYQLWEAKAWGASAALLIVAALEDALLRDLRATAAAIGVDALVEVHTEAEAERALAAGALIVGVNHRDLATFRTERDATARVAKVVPKDVLLVSESGIKTRADVLEVERAGARAVLVGEALVTSADPGAKTRELIGRAAGAPS
ncbi:MAG: indole-3-glycerol phosphate synthase TrpC [bacterium]